MSTPSDRPSQEAPTEAAPAEAHPDVADLHAEISAEQNPIRSSLLVHELGVLEERLGDDLGAAREYLTAFNAQPQFREPLEGLLRIFERRKSIKNLGKLFEALERAAATPEERARALVKRAGFVADQQQDDTLAQSLLEQAVEERPSEMAAWLELELLAGRTNDADLRRRALEARARGTPDPSWRGLLLLDLGDLEAEAGNVERALSLTDEAATIDGLGRFSAGRALESFGKRFERADIEARGLEIQGELIALAVADGTTGDALGVPTDVRSAEAIADAWLRAADARKRAGDPTAAAALLDRAMQRLPDDTTLAYARMSIAELAGDTYTAAEVAKGLLAKGTEKASAAALWMRVAEAAANRSDLPGALEALASAIAADPGCIPARALQIDLLGNGSDPAALGAAVESMGAELPTDAGKARAYLLAGLVYALLARDSAGARTALSEAGMYGAAPGLLARLARSLASVLGDAAWYEEATKRLTLAGAEPDEKGNLCLELARLRLLRSDDDDALTALAALADAPRGAWLGQALAAYAVGLRKGAETGAARPRPAETLEKLGRMEPDAAVARAFALGAARRSELSGDREAAIAKLRALLAEEASDPLVAVCLADLLRQAQRPLEAAEVLAACAEALEPSDLASSLQVEAIALQWAAGDRPGATTALRSLAHSAVAGTDTWLAWVERAVSPSTLEGRGRILDLSPATGTNAWRIALERFGLEGLDPGGDAVEAGSALEGLEDDASGDIATAATLARLLAEDGSADRPRFERALERLETMGEDARIVARAERTRMARADGDATLALECAHKWADASRLPDASIEWLVAATIAEDRPAEVRARRRLAGQLAGEARITLEANAAMVALVHDPAGPQALLRAEHPAAQISNLELAPLGSDPLRRSAALLGIGDALGENGTQTDALTLAGYNQLAAGDAAAALVSFEAASGSRPDDLYAWEGVRSAAEKLNDREREVAACMNLGRLCSDNARGAELWERAGIALLEKLNRPEQAETAFEQAFMRDASRATSFDRLFRRVRDRKDGEKMLTLIERRLEVAEDSTEIAKLFWEQARMLRQKGDHDGALSALRNVTMIEPDHVGALALSGEMFIRLGQFDEAADALSRLSTLGDAPAQQRLMSGVASVDLFENKLGKSDRALEVLLAMHRGGLSTIPVRERIARLATKMEAWPEATQVLEQLMVERTTPEGRVEAARLSMAIWRDKREKPEQAAKAVVKLLEERPDDAEALDFTLRARFDGTLRKALLDQGRDAVVASLAENPLDATRVELLSRIAAALADAPLRQASLGALVAVRGGNAEVERELADLDRRVARLPRMALTDPTLGWIADPDDAGPMATLFAELAPSITEALGPSLTVLGVTKKNRIDPRSGLPLRNEVAAWAGALGLGEFELYVGGPNPRAVTAVAGEVPVIVVGSGIEAPLTPAGRQAIVRELFALRRGTSVLRTRDDTTVAAIFVATCRIAEISVDSPPYAMLDEVQRQLGKALPRKTKKVAVELCQKALAANQVPRTWARAANFSMDRMAVIAAGDASLVLSDVLSTSRDDLARVVTGDERAAKLLGFVLSPRYLELREELGMGVK